MNALDLPLQLQLLRSAIWDTLYVHQWVHDEKPDTWLKMSPWWDLQQRCMWSASSTSRKSKQTRAAHAYVCHMIYIIGHYKHLTQKHFTFSFFLCNLNWYLYLAWINHVQPLLKTTSKAMKSWLEWKLWLWLTSHINAKNKNKIHLNLVIAPDSCAAMQTCPMVCLRWLFTGFQWSVQTFYSPYGMTVAKVQGRHDLSEELPGFFGR